MRSFYTPGLILVALAALVASGCGGGSSVPHAATASNTNYTVKIAIPMAGSGAASAKRKPAYVSASLQSIVVAILGASNQQLVQGNNYVNITPTGTASNADCTTPVAAPTTCTITLNAAIGSGGNFTVAVATYDAQQTVACMPGGTPACSGNLLSVSDLPQNVTPGQTLTLTLGGIPAYLQGVELVSGYMLALGGTGGNFTLFGPGAHKIHFEFLDADKNIIIGTGAPALTVTSGNSGVLAASVSSTAGSGLYTLTLTPLTVNVGGLPVVQPTSVPVQFGLTVPGTTLSSSGTIPFAIAHSVVYAAAQNAVCCTISIFAYFDGNTTASWSVYNTGNGNIGITTDLAGNLWMADPGNNYVAEWANPQPSPAPFQNNPSGTWSYPESLAFDISGNAFVASCGYFACSPSTADSLVEYYAPTPASTPNFTTTGFTNYSNTTQEPFQVAVDGNDNAYVGIYDSVATAGKAQKYPSGSSSAATEYTLASTAIRSLAVEPYANNLWVVNGGTAYLINSLTATPTGTSFSSPALNGTLGITTDSLGNVWVANTGGTGVAEFSPPTYAAVATLGSSSVVSVAVYPNSLVGQKSAVGVLPSPTPSPLPLPMPS
jgi:sugar lactone lactonase YvrE